jgi:hypothetical protein
MGGVLAALQFSFTHYWMNSYWGGSLAAIGGCLVLGALPRLKANPRPSYAMLFALGLMILANTRPFEGLMLSLAVAAALALWLVRQDAAFLRRFFLRVAVPALLVIVPIFCLMMVENKAVTGSPFKFAHETYRHQWGIVQTFVWEKARQPPIYNHEKMLKFFIWEQGNSVNWGTLHGLVPGIKDRLWGVGSSFFPHVLYLPFAFVSFAAGLSKRIRWLGIAVAAVFAGSLLSRWMFAHYLAPIWCALMGIHLQFLRQVRVWRWKGIRIGAAAYSGILCFLLVLFAARIYNRTVHPGPVWAPMRETIRRSLESTPGKHLVIVNYRDEHAAVDEWVFNEPDIPTAKVIWARAMTPVLDRELERYFSDRSAWEVDVDADPPALRRR